MFSPDAAALLRRTVKSAGAYGLYATGLDRLVAWLGGRGREPLVLCYHRVVEDVREHPSSAPAMLVGRATLERQLGWIARRYRFVGLDQLARAIEAGTAEDGPQPMAAVTFDDGYADVFRVGFPLLQRMGIPAAVFVPTDFVGTDRLLVHDELNIRLLALARRSGHVALAGRLRDLGVPAEATRGLEGPRAEAQLLELKERLLESWPREPIERLIAELAQEESIPLKEKAPLESVTWEMLAEMRSAGTVIGSHTCSHSILSNESPAGVAAELVGSKRALEEKLGGEVSHFAYPDGQFTGRTLEAARAAGYRYAYSICDHRSVVRPLLSISRLTLWERSSAGLLGSFSPAIAACQVRGVFEHLRPCHRDHHVGASGRSSSAPGGDVATSRHLGAPPPAKPRARPAGRLAARVPTQLGVES